MMVKLEKSLNSGIPESTLRDLEESFDSKISDLSRRLEMIDSKLKGIEKDIPDKGLEQLTKESVQGIIEIETKEISKSIIVLKKEIKNHPRTAVVNRRRQGDRGPAIRRAQRRQRFLRIAQIVRGKQNLLQVVDALRPRCGRAHLLYRRD